MQKISVLIVDDEKPARELLKRVIDWEEFGFYICGEAKNGEEAYVLYKTCSPDIIITDIQMPRMTGLELIKKIREEDSEKSFIILSCYENFSYAREAIRMNVEDYLLKDLLVADDLKRLMLTIGEQKIAAKRTSEQLIAPHNKSNQNPNIEHLVSTKMQSNQELKRRLMNLDTKSICEMLKLDNHYKYVVFIVSIDNYYNSKDKYFEHSKELLKSKLTTILENYNREINNNLVEFAYVGNGKYFVIVKIGDYRSENKTIQEIYNIANTMRKSFLDIEYEHTLSIGISKVFADEKELVERYTEAYDALGYRFFLGKNKNIHYTTVLPKVTNISEESLNNLINQIKEGLEHKDIESIIKKIREIYLENLFGFMQYNYLKEVNDRMFYLISDFCNTYQIKYQELFGVNYLPMQKVDQFDTVDEICTWFMMCFEKGLEIAQATRHYSRHIKDAIAYIESHYASGISLSEVSEVLNLHKVYLSRLFKEEVGMTISNYILNYRMEAAKKLMCQTNLKLYKIAEHVGYTNAKHFMVSFKKSEGITPKEYRERINK